MIGFEAAPRDDPQVLEQPQTPSSIRQGAVRVDLAKPGFEPTTGLHMEGYMDVITSFQHGIDYTVAGMGTALTPLQARTLMLLSPRIYLVYDQDEAGQRAARRTIDVFREAGGRTSVVTYDGAKDPDEFLKTRGPQRFVERLDEALTDIQFIYETARKTVDVSKMDGKLRVKEIMVPILASLESQFEVSALYGGVLRELGVRKESLDKDVELYRRRARQEARHKKSENRNTTGHDNQPEQGLDRGSSLKAGDGRSNGEIPLVRRKAEEGVIRCLVEKPGLLASMSNRITVQDLMDTQCRRAFEDGEGRLIRYDRILSG